MNFEINENSEKRFMDGWINRVIRWYFFVKEGVNQATALKTLAYVLIGISGVLALNDAQSNYWLIVIIGIVSIPIFGVLGWMWVIRGKKSEEYYQTKYTSPYGQYTVELQEEQMKLLREIRDGINKLNENLNN